MLRFRPSTVVIAGKRAAVKVIEGDITKPLCGVSDLDLGLWRGRVKRVVHCAASISFDDAKETEATNVGGVINALKLADELGITEFHHVSTTYVGGAAERFSEDEIEGLQNKYPPRNTYEATKQSGERCVRLWASFRNGRRYAIYRPSILIGRQDGTTPTFDAYYGYFKPIHALAEFFRRMARKGEALPPGVGVAGNGIVSMPIILSTRPGATLDVVPIDWVADRMADLIQVPVSNTVYHLVNPAPPFVRWVIDVSLAHLKVCGVHVAETDEDEQRLLAAQSPALAAFQKKFLCRNLARYRPYTHHGARFLAENARCVLGERFLKFREIDAGFLGELLDNAVAENWGAPEGSGKSA